MKLLITGAGGQLGKEWVDFCKDHSIDYNSFSSNELDITDEDKVAKVIADAAPGVLINCAAYTKVDEAEENKQTALKINAESVKKLAAICKRYHVKMVHYSTDYVFAGNKSDKEESPEGYKEEDSPDPVNEYGYSKLKGEEAIKDSGCEFLLLRVSWLCGQYGHNFVKTMLRLGAERDVLSVVNDQFGSPTFADQVVEQTFELLQQNKTGTYHLSSDGMTTWFDFSKEIFKQKGINVNVNPVSSVDFPTKAKRPFFSKLSTQKISNVDGVLILDWKAGLQRLLKQL
ncbi:MAG: dTDP-4-dehydrorhamnose reductase [Balneola sp.]|nr:dTDP-4-dehydrorhamnose reductase [Balneola sp.]MBO6650386.1 dTDP-4-dehydrorhamnose reductase [Balneola sp.]MBO6710217.1 dTDP-4-dehydrorhamnose reductase [Balneola sp.]MBO6798902.1 dTDP-4-dehydrorhamnose reductase [Balneola sp.]MBO6870016.1 dTDP-4-dehydrorhamnose reductase [Balneola sp.]